MKTKLLRRFTKTANYKIRMKFYPRISAYKLFLYYGKSRHIEFTKELSRFIYDEKEAIKRLEEARRDYRHHLIDDYLDEHKYKTKFLNV